MTLQFLTTEQILQLHKCVINEFGGAHGIRDSDSLEAATLRPQTGYYTTLNEHAAALMESLANNHAFLDGNKRIAFFATDTFLRLNGYWINCDPEETYDYFMKLFETGDFRFNTLLTWLNLTTEPL